MTTTADPSGAPTISRERAGRAPRFAVQRDDGRVLVVAVHARLHYQEVVPIAAVPDLTAAAAAARVLTEAWSWRGPVDLAEVPELAQLNTGAVEALGAAMRGCPGPDPNDALDCAVELESARIGVLFTPALGQQADPHSRMTGRQALWLHHTLVVTCDGLGPSFEEADVDRVVESWSEAEWATAPEVATGRTGAWWNEFRQALADLAADIAAGREPKPVTFAETVALWKGMLDAAMGMAHSDDEGEFGARVVAPQNADQLWEPVFGRLILPVLELLGPSMIFHGMDFSGLCRLLAPEDWHRALPGRAVRDPARLQ